METLEQKRDYLISLGYMAHIRPGDNCIIVSGTQQGAKRKYFNAKNAKANTITAELNRTKGITAAWNLKAYDGFYDFYCK